MVSLAAGRLPGCRINSATESNKAPFAVDADFSEIRGIAFSPLGELFIAESEVIWIRRSDGRLYLFAGSKNAPTWNTPQTTSSRLLNNPLKKSTTLPYTQLNLLSNYPATDFHFANISTITVGIFGEVFVADTGHNAVFAVYPESPKLTSGDDKFVIQRRASEMQIFDKHGQLESIMDTLTQYKFIHFTFTANAWLSGIRVGALELFFKRSPPGYPQQVLLNSGDAYNLTVEPMNRGFGSITSPFGGLYRYGYAKDGHLTKIWTPSSALPYVTTYSTKDALLEGIVLPSGWIYPFQGVKGSRKQIDTKEITVISSPNGEVIKLTYSSGAQEVIFERLEPLSNRLIKTEDHASWQIGRRIRMYVQPQLAENHLLAPSGSPASTIGNSSAPMPRLIENL